MDSLTAKHYESQCPKLKPFAREDVDRQALHVKSVEGRKAAIPKGDYCRAIAKFCYECSGSLPARTDCQANNDCLIYPINTPTKRRAVTKSALRKIIKAECILCTDSNVDICTSPNCNLYQFRYGRKPVKADLEGLEVAADMDEQEINADLDDEDVES